jgi:hypothetical protein
MRRPMPVVFTLVNEPGYLARMTAGREDPLVLNLAGFLHRRAGSQKRLELYAVFATIAASRWTVGIPQFLRCLQKRIKECEINVEFKRFRHEGYPHHLFLTADLRAAKASPAGREKVDPGKCPRVNVVVSGNYANDAISGQRNLAPKGTPRFTPGEESGFCAMCA